VAFDRPAQQLVFQEHADAVKAASESIFWPVIEALMALRGVTGVRRGGGLTGQYISGGLNVKPGRRKMPGHTDTKR